MPQPPAKSAISGFTLVELVVTIAILAILAASALPRFVNTNQSAINSSLQSMKGTLTANASLMRSKCTVTEGCDGDNVWYLEDGGQTFQMWRGWPDAGDNLNNNELDVQITYSGFTVSIANSQEHIFKHNSASDPNNCYVKYTESLTYGTPPTVSIVNSGC